MGADKAALVTLDAVFSYPHRDVYRNATFLIFGGASRHYASG